MAKTMRDLFRLDDTAWSVIEPLLPKNRPGARRVDDRRVISGIVHVLQAGCRWRDRPPEYGPSTTIYNRFHRWSRRRVGQCVSAALVDHGRLGGTVAIDSTYVKAHRSAAGAQKKRVLPKPSVSAEAVAARKSTERPIFWATDLLGRPIVLQRTPGNRADIGVAPDLVAEAGPCRRLLADRAYPSRRPRLRCRPIPRSRAPGRHQTRRSRPA